MTCHSVTIDCGGGDKTEIGLDKGVVIDIRAMARKATDAGRLLATTGRGKGWACVQWLWPHPPDPVDLPE